MIDRGAVQGLRGVLRSILATTDITTAVCAIESVIADLMVEVIDQDEGSALQGARAIASDVENVIRERFAAKGRAN